MAGLFEDMAGARKRKHLSQDALAGAMRDAGHGSWRQNTVHRVESGVQEPSHAEAVTLAELLGLDLFAGGSAPVPAVTFAEVADRGDRRATLVALRRLVAERIEQCDTSRDMPPLVARFLEVERELQAVPDEDATDAIDAVMEG